MSENPELEKQFDEKWAEVVAIYEKAQMHPVVPQVMMMLMGDEGLALRHEWTKPMVESFWTYLEPAYAEKTHRKAIDDLIRIAHYLNTKQDRLLLATGLLVLLNEAVIKWKLVDMEVNAKFEGADDKAAANAVTGGKDRPVPAKVGEKAPEGSVRPDQLVGSKRRI